MTNRMRLWGNKLAGGGGAGATGLGIMAASAGTGAAHMMGVDPYTAMAIGGAVGTGVGKAGTTHRRCPTSRDFVPWRFSDAGRRTAWIASSCRHPKTLYGAYWRQGESGGAVESFCHVTRLHLRHGQPFARLRRAVKPQSRLRRAEGAGLDRECAVRAIIIVAATYKGHSALFEALWIGGPLLSPT